MNHLEAVEKVADGRSRWQARMTGGVPLSWEAVTVRDEGPSASGLEEGPASSGTEGVLEWQPEDDATVDHYGQLRFVPKEDGQATELRVQMRYRPPHPRDAIVRVTAGAGRDN